MSVATATVTLLSYLVNNVISVVHVVLIFVAPIVFFLSLSLQYYRYFSHGVSAVF